jgi:outer membrane receptor for Fe3+-dicitrate
VAYRPGPRATLQAAARWDSGLPVELEGEADLDQLRSQYGAAIVDRVDFAAGRVKPSAAVDLSLSMALWSRGDQALRAHLDVFNASNRLNVTNFAGLLSGTAVAAPRSWSARLEWQF